jgi:hypothetical protein
MAEWVASLGFWWYVIFYLVIQIINVVLNTLKTIITSRASKLPASIINALTFGFYTCFDCGYIELMGKYGNNSSS